MIPMPAGTRIWVACGATDMRKGFDGLAMLVQDVVKQSPYSGHIFVFRGSGRTELRFCGGMARACASTRSGWNAGGLCGR